LVEKILAQHALSDTEVVPGNVICLNIGWTLELQMYYDRLGKPGVLEMIACG
jgi:homoaconitate hydratase